MSHVKSREVIHRTASGSTMEALELTDEARRALVAGPVICHDCRHAHGEVKCHCGCYCDEPAEQLVAEFMRRSRPVATVRRKLSRRTVRRKLSRRARPPVLP